MAASKWIKANERIAAVVTGAFAKVQDRTVGAYEKIEDRFVGAYLTRDGETVQQAKDRLKRGR